MKTNQEIQDMKKDCAKAIGEVTDGSEDVYKGWIEALNWVTMTNEDPADRDDRLYHEEQDHIAMEKAKETK